MCNHGTVEDFVRIHTAASATEGHLLEGLLEAEGIPVLTKGEGDGPYRMGPLHLWVHADHEIHARLLVEEAVRGERAIDATRAEDDPD